MSSASNRPEPQPSNRASDLGQPLEIRAPKPSTQPKPGALDPDRLNSIADEINASVKKPTPKTNPKRWFRFEF